MKARILFVEDEAGIAEVVTDLLRAEGHEATTVADGRLGLERARHLQPDLLILDLMLPGLDGFAICDAMRRQGFEGGILMLTARGQLRDRVDGLAIGADDYLVKPFDSEELLARVNALLRRVRKTGLTPVERVAFGRVNADFARMEFTRDGAPLALAAKEAELLRFLVNQRGRVLGRDEILRQVWREQPAITERTVDVHIAWLRQKVEENPQAPRHIQTVRGEGYRFEISLG